MSAHRPITRRGFTLVELMVVVVLAAVLALVGLRAMDLHVAASKSIEAMGMVRSIQSAQARYRAVTGLFLDVSSEGSFYPRTPSGAEGLERVAFFYPEGSGAPPDNSRWLELNPTVAGSVQYGYMTRAGLPGTLPPSLQIPVSGFMSTAPTDLWFFVEAVGDVDGDENLSHFYVSSSSDTVYFDNEIE
jgi:prepilin-type N-terminal cleavage/methylation domain-containing protein